MSIILDALKKAEKDQAENKNLNESSDGKTITPTNEPPQNTTPVVVESSSSKRSSLMRVLLFLMMLSGLGYLGYQYGPQYYAKYFPQNNQNLNNIINSNLPIKNIPEQPIANIPDPKSKIPNLTTMALTLFKQDKFDQSEKVWLEILSIDPENAEAYNNLGLTYKKLKQTEKAKFSYLNALDHKSNYPEALNNLGVILLGEPNEEPKAYSLFSKAVEINPDYPEAHFHLAVLLERKGDFERALQHYQKFLDGTEDLPTRSTGQIKMKMTLIKAQL